MLAHPAVWRARHTDEGPRRVAESLAQAKAWHELCGPSTTVPRAR